MAGVEHGANSGDGFVSGSIVAPVSSEARVSLTLGQRLAEKAARLKEQSGPISISEAIDRIVAGEVPHYPNSSFRISNAIMDKDFGQPKVLPSGYTDYSFFSERGDEYEVNAQHRAIEALVDILRAGRSTGGKDKMIVLAGAKGAGKSLIVNALKKGVEEHAAQKPSLAIEGCEMHCSPVSLVTYLGKFKPHSFSEIVTEMKNNGIETDADLCPNCQDRLKQSSFELDQFRTVPFYVSPGEGIIVINPDDTYYDETGGKVKEKIKKSNGGILEISELGSQVDFAKLLNDLAAGRRMQDEMGREIRLDCIMIAHMTLDQWKTMEKDPVFDAFIDRLQVIKVPYLLSRSDETTLCTKFLKRSMTPDPDNLDFWVSKDKDKKDPIHINQRVSRIIADVAVWSRLKNYTRKSDPPGKDIILLSPDTKVDFYDGEDIAGYTQQDLRMIQEDGAGNGEGFEGVSPRFAEQILPALISETEKCLDAFFVLSKLRETLTYYPIDITKKLPILGRVERVKGMYEQYLGITVRKAFHADYEGAWSKELNAYLDALEFQESGTAGGVVIDHSDPMQIIRGKIPDVSKIQSIEATLQATEKSTQRALVFNRIANLHKEGKPITPDAFASIPWLKERLDEIVYAQTGKPEDILRHLAGLSEQFVGDPSYRERFFDKDTNEYKKLQAVEQNLIENYGFCECCAWRSMTHVAKKPNLLKVK